MPTITRHVPGTPAWFDLMTSDPAGAKAFYAGLFGWEIEDTGPEYGHHAMGKLGGRNAAGMGEKPADVPWPSPGRSTSRSTAPTSRRRRSRRPAAR